MKFIKNSLLIIFSILIAFCIAEIFVRYYFFTSAERSLGAKNLADYENNSFVQATIGELKSKNECGFASTLQAHPFLGFVHTRTGPCGNTSSNKQGFPSLVDIPKERDPNFFTIFIVGGSVASQLALADWKSGSWLERNLNAKYKSPNGKPFRAISGGFGAWSYPTQIISTILYGQGADAIVAIDGYNEALNMKNSVAIDQIVPEDYLSVVHSPVSNTRDNLSKLAVLRHQTFQNKILSHFFVMHFLFKTLIGLTASNQSYRAAYDEGVGRFFAFPEKWDQSKKESWNLEAYIRYVKLGRAVAESSGLLYAHFLQPVRELYKPLTDREQKFPVYIDTNQYLKMEKSILQLKAARFPTESLVHIFAGNSEEIYADHIHCQITRGTGTSLGYEKMSKAMADFLALSWGLKKK